MEFIDIAGLVDGASKGEGLGNQFLGHIRATDAILHVVRCFHDAEVIHVAGRVYPLDDIDIINTELLLADLDTVQKRAVKAEKAAKSQSATQAQKTEFSAVAKLLAVLEAGKPARTADLTDDERIAARELFLITSKPMLYVANVDEAGIASGNEYTDVVENRAAEEKSEVVRICGAMEAEIAQLDPSERAEFLEAAGLEEPGLNRLIHAAYRLLGLITYFTAGVQEVRAWTIRRGTKAPGAAGVIHSDFERGFIKADAYTPTTSSASAPSRPSKKPASSAPKARSTPSRTATSSSSNSTCSLCRHGEAVQYRAKHRPPGVRAYLPLP